MPYFFIVDFPEMGIRKEIIMENKLVPIEHNGVRVITTELLAQVYETDTNNIKNNFNNHKDNFLTVTDTK